MTCATVGCQNPAAADRTVVGRLEGWVVEAKLCRECWEKVTEGVLGPLSLEVRR